MKKKFCIAKHAFTLAEVLITLAIIGVVAAITIPSVIVNTNQMEFKTGLRKAVSVLNQAITLNKALTGESPYDNRDLYNYLQQNMSVMKKAVVINNDLNAGYPNAAFYTTDGMRFETFDQGTGGSFYDFPLHENPKINAKSSGTINNTYLTAGYCGSLGLAHNQDSTTNPPCIMAVDVNGDRKPTPSKTESSGVSTGYSHIISREGEAEVITSSGYKYADPKGRLLTDMFSVMITDQGAIPYGVVAQKAMYQAQK